jgi:thioredoxin reductase (NADPH)
VGDVKSLRFGRNRAKKELFETVSDTIRQPVADNILQPIPKESYDVVIVGAGPAGLSAALWCADLGLSAAVFEYGAQVGGQLLWIHNPIDNYIGSQARNGVALRDGFADSVARAGVEVRTGQAVDSIEIDEQRVVVEGQSIAYSSLILATGVRRRRLNITGEQEFRGSGVLESGVAARDSLHGQTVIVVGGGDAALENSIILSETAAHVVLVHRRKEFSARSSFVEKACSLANVRIIREAEIIAIKGTTSVGSVDVRSVESNSIETINADTVLIRVGVEPNSELVANNVKRDPKGYVIVDALGRSSCPGVYAIGDVANPMAPTIAGATGMGATAVKAVFSELRRS